MSQRDDRGDDLPDLPSAHDADAHPSGPGQYRSSDYPQPVARLSSVRGLGAAIQVLLGAQLVVAVFVFLIAMHDRATIVASDTDPTPLADDQGLVVMSTLGLVLLVATGVVWIVWFFRLRRNVDAWGSQFQRRNIGWTIGGWLCPIVNLYFPYAIAVDILDDTQATSLYAERRTRPTISIWWTSWLILVITRVIVDDLGHDPSMTVAQNQHTLVTGVAVLAAVTGLATIPAVFAVRQLTAVQTARIAGRL